MMARSPWQQQTAVVEEALPGGHQWTVAFSREGIAQVDSEPVGALLSAPLPMESEAAIAEEYL
jgi:hypothetical protein